MNKSRIQPDGTLRRVAFLSSYPPRECGIAMFTKELADSIEALGVFKPTVVIAENDSGAIYHYDRRVKSIIEQEITEDYYEAAHYVNISDIDLVNIQHEFGLFGGDYGNYILYLLDQIKKPIVTTLHTVQPDFNSKAISILKKITEKSAAIVIITPIAKKILNEQNISTKKCKVIPHGCPQIKFVKTQQIKAQMNLRNKFIISTFGLLSRGKGIEYVIQAMPSILEKEPNAIYLIIGETHPEVRKKEGEQYRNELITLKNELELHNHVKFHNRFLTKRELVKYLQLTDVYVTPYNSPNQISSGTLVYAVGAGKPVVSTPYLHALDVLGNGRGLFCKFKNPESIANNVIKLMDDSLREEIRKRAFKYSRKFLWQNVAKSYADLFREVMR